MIVASCPPSPAALAEASQTLSAYLVAAFGEKDADNVDSVFKQASALEETLAQLLGFYVRVSEEIQVLQLTHMWPYLLGSTASCSFTIMRMFSWHDDVAGFATVSASVSAAVRVHTWARRTARPVKSSFQRLSWWRYVALTSSPMACITLTPAPLNCPTAGCS